MKNNKDAVKQLFKEFTLMLRGFGSIDGNIIASDGTKIKASDANNKHFNEAIIKETSMLNRPGFKIHEKQWKI